MHACDFQRCAAVCLTLPASNTGSTMIIRYDRQPVACSETVCIARYILSCNFMSKYTGISKERLSAVKCMQISATNPNLSNPYKRISWLDYWQGCVGVLKVTGSLTYKGIHSPKVIQIVFLSFFFHCESLTSVSLKQPYEQVYLQHVAYIFLS